MEGKISATIINHRDVNVKAGVLADCCSAHEDGIYSREVSLSLLLLFFFKRKTRVLWLLVGHQGNKVR